MVSPVLFSFSCVDTFIGVSSPGAYELACVSFSANLPVRGILYLVFYGIFYLPAPLYNVCYDVAIHNRSVVTPLSPPPQVKMLCSSLLA